MSTLIKCINDVDTLQLMISCVRLVLVCDGKIKIKTCAPHTDAASHPSPIPNTS